MNSSNFTRMEIFSPVNMATFSRSQEKQELQQLNDRFAAYVQRVRLMAEKNGQVDSSALLKSAKAMEAEILNLRNMYEHELEKLRKEVEGCNHEKAMLQVQTNKQMQCCAELQDRLNVETSKTAKLQEEIANHQRRASCLEAEIQDLKMAINRPRADLEQLQRTVANMTREIEAWKHRYEHEQVARQEAETRIQQLMQRSDFNDKVSAKRVGELNSRIEMSAATILTLEAKVRDLSKADVSVSELLKQVRDTAEAELKKYQMESEEQYNKNLTTLKTQLDGNAKVMENLETEKTQLLGSNGELQARIRSLEGQVANLEHQKKTLEDAIAMERSRAAESARALELKVREVQEMLVVKMREVTSAREQNIPLKAEIEALKALLEEEERRVKLSLPTSTSKSSAVSATAATTILPPLSPPSKKTPSSPRSGLQVPLAFTSCSSAMSNCPEPLSAYNSIAAANTAANASTFSAMATNTTPFPMCSGVTQPMSYSSYPPLALQSAIEEARPYVPSPPLSVTYIPESLHPTGTSIDPMFAFPQYEDELDPQLFGYSGTMPLAKYTCENSPSLNRVAVEPSPPCTPRPTPKSAPAERHRNLNLVRSDLGQGHDYFDKMFYDLQQDTLYSQGRPKSSQNERPSSVYHDYSVSTSSATGEVKISEVQQEGKYIRLVNEGTQELEFGGFMIQQNVGGHPVAVFRFPPRTKFAPTSSITVYAGCSDRKLHKPPQDFVWKEQQKWGSGPECTTILCRANGQAVAWTTAAHRFSRDAFQEGQNDTSKAVTIVEKKMGEEAVDEDGGADGNTSGNAARTETVVLRREKQQPPSLLQASGQLSHSSGQGMPALDSQQGVQSVCPDIAPVGSSSSQRKYVSGISTQQHTAMRGGTGKSKKNFLNYLLNDTALH